jgi:TonB family protein
MSAALFLLLPVLAQEPAPAPSPTPAAQEPAAQAPAPAESPATPAASPAPDAPRVAGKDVPWPKRTKSVTPIYPAAAQAIGQRGIVIVQLLVGADGKVVSADVVRSVPPFDEPALAAVRQWEYEITRVNGQPVPVLATIPITFALRLPDVTRESGVPEMRQGIPPPFPGQAQDKLPARATAELLLEADGTVREAAITAGDPPFSEALLQAVRTWAFVPLSSSGRVSLDVEATFSGGKEGQRVQLRLFGLREVPSATSVAGLPPSPPPAAPASAAPASPPPTSPAPPASTTADPAPQAAAPASTAPSSAPPPPATAPAAREPARPPATPPTAGAPPGRPAPAGVAPPATAQGRTAPPVEVEVVPGAPPPRPTDTTLMETGVSAVRDVVLTEGVPDLTSGRRPMVPPLARMEGLTGQVEVRFVVEASGATSNIEIAGPERLREAARQTVGSWTFRRSSTERLFLVTTIDYGAETARAAVKRQS